MQSIRGEDAPFSFRFAAPEAAIEALGLTHGRTASDRAVQAAVIAAAAVEHDGAGRWISYSRSHDWWAAGRYEGTPVTMRRVIRTVEELAAKGLVESFIQTPGAHLLSDETRRVQSAFRAWPALTNRLGGIRMDAIERPPVVLKDADGDPIPFPRTERAARIRREVEDLNAWLATFDVRVDPAADPTNWKRTAYHLHARKVRKDGSETWACTLPTPTPQVVRIFGRGRLDRHGRLYGWWQGLPKDRRGELLVNGEVLIEEDFASLHPTLLYAMKGVVLRHDPYDVWAFPRREAKLALNIAINADGGLRGAVNALMAKADWGHGRRYTLRLLAEVAKRNETIREYLGSDAGVMLMSHDSRMCLNVLKACRRAGIAALPVHDSFQAPASKAGQVRAIMGEVLDRVRVTISPAVSVASALPFLHNAPAAVPSLPSPPLEAPVPAGVSPPFPPALSRTLAPSTPVPDPHPLPGPAHPLRTLAPSALPASYAGCTSVRGVSTPSLAPAVLAVPWASLDASTDPRAPVSEPSSAATSREGRTAPLASYPFPDPRSSSIAFPDLAWTSEPPVTRTASAFSPVPGPHVIYVDGKALRGSPAYLRPIADELLAQGLDPYAPPLPEPVLAPGLARAGAYFPLARVVAGQAPAYTGGTC